MSRNKHNPFAERVVKSATQGEIKSKTHLAPSQLRTKPVAGRVPVESKEALKAWGKEHGVSVNVVVGELVNLLLTDAETEAKIEALLQKRIIAEEMAERIQNDPELYQKVSRILDEQ